MIKKIFLTGFCFLSLLNSFAQPNLDPAKGRTCGTPTPDKEWNEWFNKLVEQRKADIASGKVTAAPWVIPIIVHVIHNGQPVGTADNISQAQVQDQVNILNADFAGTGFNNANAPAIFAPLKADLQISFCLAVKDPTGGILPQPGIDRVDRNAHGWTNGPYTSAYVDANIKPTTIWDPTRYCNVWVANLGGGLLGYATFPAGTSLSGITGGGTSTTDGVVILNTAFGSVGTATAPPYNKGRTITHELGHWLGLRHMWGDGTCLTDFCNDTPPAQNSNFGCSTSCTGGCFTHPYKLGACPTNTTGEMTMNFMDYTDDPCMYMFTLDQKTRAHTAMTQGTYRSLLGTHGLCSIVTPSPGPASASFSIPGKPCVGQAFTPSNTSNGSSPTFSWLATPNASIVTTTSASPNITFTVAGTYTLQLLVTSGTTSSTYSQILDVGKCPVCLDTINYLKNTDTLTRYKAPTNSLILACQSASATGFLTGTNCYNDKEFAQFFPLSTYSDTPNPQVSNVIVLFDSTGTKSAGSGTTQIFCKVYGGTMNNGPNSFIGQTAVNLSAIIATTPKPKNVTYCGNPNYTLTTTQIIPYKFTFGTPAIIPPSALGFFASVQTPYSSPLDSIRILSNTKYNSPAYDSSAWLLNITNNWRTIVNSRGTRVKLGIVPIVSCRPVAGVKENEASFTQNVTVIPNPNSGIFSLVFTLPKEENIAVKIYNSMGQLLSDSYMENIGNNVININLSDKAEGVYFVAITNGTTKIVKKVIVSR